jgi:primosomal protein N'
LAANYKKMKIQKITSQSRRDFWATMECEYCGNVEKDVSGYDDANFHNNVIPEMKCKQCGKKGSEDYRPLAPKYGSHEVV